jgi:hypothetical protein
MNAITAHVRSEMNQNRKINTSLISLIIITLLTTIMYYLIQNVDWVDENYQIVYIIFYGIISAMLITHNILVVKIKNSGLPLWIRVIRQLGFIIIIVATLNGILNAGALSVGEFLLFLNPFLIFHFACFFITKNHCKGQSLLPISWVKYGLFSLTVSYVLFFHIFLRMPLYFIPPYFGFFYLCFMLVDSVFNYIQLLIKSKNQMI